MMMNCKWNKWLCLLCYILPVAVNAGGIVVNPTTFINITGKVLPSSCTIATNKNTLDINLGTYADNTLTTVGKILTSKSLSVSLTGCNSGIIGTVVTLSGAVDQDDPTLLALSNPESDDTAKGLAILLKDKADNIIPVNGKSVLQTLVAGDNTLTFKLAYKVTKLPVTTGSANAVLYLDMAYQ